jgi:hypothetical protein
MSTQTDPVPAKRRRKPLPAGLLLMDTSEQLQWPMHCYASKHIDFTLREWNMPEADYAAVLASEADMQALIDASPRTDTVIRNEALALQACAPAVCLVERKSLSDLCGTLTHGRVRFEAQLERMRPYGMKYIIVETDLPGISKGGLYSRTRVRSIVGSLAAFEQRHANLHVVMGSDRRHAAAYAFLAMERWCRDRHEALKKKEQELF